MYTSVRVNVATPKGHVPGCQKTASALGPCLSPPLRQDPLLFAAVYVRLTVLQALGNSPVSTLSLAIEALQLQRYATVLSVTNALIAELSPHP